MTGHARLSGSSRVLRVAFALLSSIASSMAVGADEPLDWRQLEAGALEHQTQLTFPRQFVKAGESYFSPDGQRVIFQAVEVPDEGKDPEEFYAMFVGDLVTGDEPRWQLQNIRRISPAGSANTCGWFHPTEPDRVIFASTVGPPTASDPPGFQRGTSRYRWSFPPETRIVEVDLATLPWVPLRGESAPPGRREAHDVPADALAVLAGDGTAYVAEGSLSNDGRTLLFCTLATNQGDLAVKDLEEGAITPLISVPGYDGGPFFSPDARRICYRSDRAGNNLLQIYVAELEFNDDGRVRGAIVEHAVTANNDVNWCPFWHPKGEHLVFATSAIGHRNYEIFMVDARSDDSTSPPQRRYGTNARRITHADGADVLPVFDATGRHFMWTSQRADDRTSQLWMADFVMPLVPQKADPAVGGRPARSAAVGEGR